MKIKQVFLLIFCFLQLIVFSQIKFEKGYFISNTDDTVRCLIKNVEWKNNPTVFFYKLDSIGEAEKNSIRNSKEFNIYNSSKFIKSIVNIDISDDRDLYLSDIKEPIWKTDTVFLKVIVEGKSSFYYYEKDELKRFFYKVDTFPIKQFIHKHYLIEGKIIKTNNFYLAQLRLDINCGAMSTHQNIKYDKWKLKKYIIDYNSCMGSKSVDFDKSLKLKYSVRLFGGLNYSGLKISNSADPSFHCDFDNQFTYSVGSEFEAFFPFNNNRWSLFTSPAFVYFNSTKTDPYYYNRYTYTVEYKAIAIPIGVRFNYFFNNKTRISLYPAMVFSYAMNSKIIQVGVKELIISNSINYMIGVSFEYQRFSVDYRYFTRRDLLAKHIYSSAAYTNMSLGIGFKIF
jgi:hypothetical protein